MPAPFQQEPFRSPYGARSAKPEACPNAVSGFGPGPETGRRRALLLANRLSRSGDADLASAIASLESAGIAVLPFGIGDPAEIPKLIRAHRGRINLVVLGGGDGTMNAACGAILELGVPMAILPLGTANDLARTLGIPTELDQACAIAANGAARRIDLGLANGKHFFNVASIGLSAAVARTIDPGTKRRFGAAGYALAVMRELKEHRPFRAWIDCDGRRLRLRSIQIAVGNGRHYGGGLTVVEDAAIDDHLLDLYSIAPASMLRLMLLAPALRTGRHGQFRGVHVLRGRRIEIRTRRPMPVNTDGEVTTRTPVILEILPAAIEILVPPDLAAASGGGDAAAQ
ncbi:MAG TPA: lipid kinase [Alphaproteobacteria bacterium]|nr:lipid kinase [Alphaproteobacteria bacterium]